MLISFRSGAQGAYRETKISQCLKLLWPSARVACWENLFCPLWQALVVQRFTEKGVVYIVKVDNVGEVETCVLRDIPEHFYVNISQENDEHVPEQIFIFHIERLHDLTLKYLCMKLIELGTLGVTGEEVVIRLVHLNNFCFFQIGANCSTVWIGTGCQSRDGSNFRYLCKQAL